MQQWDRERHLVMDTKKEAALKAIQLDRKEGISDEKIRKRLNSIFELSPNTINELFAQVDADKLSSKPKVIKSKTSEELDMLAQNFDCSGPITVIANLNQWDRERRLVWDTKKKSLVTFILCCRDLGISDEKIRKHLETEYQLNSIVICELFSLANSEKTEQNSN